MELHKECNLVEEAGTEPPERQPAEAAAEDLQLSYLLITINFGFVFTKQQLRKNLSSCTLDTKYLNFQRVIKQKNANSQHYAV